jgi:hypothetical protein
VDRSGLSKDSMITIEEIIQDIAVKAILDWIWIWGKITDLPNYLPKVDIPNLNVSSYMLRNFMYWDWSSEYYWNEHWISEKLMKTDFYKKQLNKAKDKVKENWFYEKIDTWDLTNDFFTDFPTSFWTVNWTMTAKINQEWQIETNFNIKDTYIYIITFMLMAQL